MPPRGSKRPPAPIGDPAVERGFHVRSEAFLVSMRARYLSPQTIHLRWLHIAELARWCDDREVHRPEDSMLALLEAFARHLYHRRSEVTGRPLATSSQASRLASVRAFFRFLAKQRLVLTNPASELDLPKLPNRLPRTVLTVAEAETVLSQPDLSTPMGIRDRAILETFYSTGMRRMDAVNLRIDDVDVDRGTVFIRSGKGQKDRMVPLGERALDWVERYRAEVRPTWARSAEEHRLFLTHRGQSFTASRMTQLVRDYVRQADIGKTGGCHAFRHTMTTLMLEGGADTRHIQEMLGHASLKTTQIYTQVSIQQLKAEHQATHPSVKRGRNRTTNSNDN